MPEIICQEKHYFPGMGYCDYLSHYKSRPWKSKGKQQLNSYKQWLMRILRKYDEVKTLWNPLQKWIPQYEKMCPKWHILSSLSFFSHDPFSLLTIPPFLFPSFSHSVFIVPVYFSLSLLPLPLFLSPSFSLPFSPFLSFPHVLLFQSPSDVSQYCIEVYHKHIWVPCCYVFNQSKLTLLYHCVSKRKPS